MLYFCLKLSVLVTRHLLFVGSPTWTQCHSQEYVFAQSFFAMSSQGDFPCRCHLWFAHGLLFTATSIFIVKCAVQIK